jgi:deazaflavin-dependent oxidoreductase (nitroreductase family)
MMNWSNRFMVWVLRSPLQRFIPGIALVELKGRKSGKLIAVPVNYLRENDFLFTVSLRNRLWWRNLIEGAPVTVRLQCRRIHATAQAVTDPIAVADGLKTMIRLAPNYARYYGITLDACGEPNRAELTRSAESRVIVRTRLG